MFFYDRNLTFARRQERFPKSMQVILLCSMAVFGLASYGSGSSFGETSEIRDIEPVSRFAFAPQNFGHYLSDKAWASLRVINRPVGGDLARPVRGARNRPGAASGARAQETGLVPVAVTATEDGPSLRDESGGYVLEKRPEDPDRADRAGRETLGGRERVVSIEPDTGGNTSSWQAREAPVTRGAVAPLSTSQARSRLQPKAGRTRGASLRDRATGVRAVPAVVRSRSAAPLSGLPAWARAALFRSQ